MHTPSPDKPDVTKTTEAASFTVSRMGSPDIGAAGLTSDLVCQVTLSVTDSLGGNSSAGPTPMTIL